MVGAGPAGAACSLALAAEGVNVLMLEKAKIPGEKNMSGGVLYGGSIGRYGLDRLVPDFEKTAPLQRRIVSHEVYALSEPNWEKGTFRYYKLSKDSLASKFGFFSVEFLTGNDYSILRCPFDGWLANQAVEAGAVLSTETTVVDLLNEDGSVKGVVTTREELRASLVVDCSGLASTLVASAGLRGSLVPRQLYHAVKHVYRLEPGKIDERLKLKPGEGRALVYLGDFMLGIGGNAFILPNTDTISVGVVASMDSMIRATTEHFDRVGRLQDVLDAFEEHPMIREILEGAELLEHSAHNIPKGFKCILKKPYSNGYLVAGDALGALVRIGAMMDGMRTAIASGMMAAQTYVGAATSGSFKEKNLSRYRDLLAPIYEDVDRSGRDSFISESRFVNRTVPRLLFGSRILSTEANVRFLERRPPERDPAQGAHLQVGVPSYDEDKLHPHIQVNAELASRSETKPWVPSCPFNCYALVTNKGVFTSFRDLYRHNLAEFGKGAAKKAFFETTKDISEGTVSFDHLACVSCGTCGAIGPTEMVLFAHEREGHGVRYKYG